MQVNLAPVLNPLKGFVNFVANTDAPVDDDGAPKHVNIITCKINEIEQFAIRGPGFTPADIPAYLNALKNMNGPGINDRDFLLERILTLMARAPDDNAAAKSIQQIAIDVLYKDLPHPPSGYLTLPTTVPPTSPAPLSGIKYAFRSANGSNYNVLQPSLGMAGSPYARSVPSTNPVPPCYLPDPDLVFDTLLKRDSFEPHPGGISSLFFAFADLVIHSIFSTDPADWTRNNVSSYLDLSPLYGSSQEQVDSVRRKDGTGRLWEDVFADGRLLFMPPSVGALLVLFCRNHNFVAERILAINEFGAYKKPDSLDPVRRAAQDEEIFQRTRLVNAGFFMQVILGDYVGAILGLTRDGLEWRLNPLETMREIGHEFAPQGEGNVVSLEFNLLYRWHATSSEGDTRWLEGLFSRVFAGAPDGQVRPAAFKNAVTSLVVDRPQDVRQWRIDNLTRGPDGRYNDADLAKILHDATEAPACAFGARRTPEVFRVIEVLAMQQARTWGACSLNEFRKFMGLKPYSDFKEWNPDPKIYKAAEALYHDINHLELHVGLQAEETKWPMPGAGLCPGFTISRAILADAVCLTRGDRFLTVDFTPFNLTSWGYEDCMYKKNDGSLGGILPKLLFRTLPAFYPERSAYAWFPFMVPNTMRGYLQRLPKHSADEYTWARPAPTPAPVPQVTLAAFATNSAGANNGNGVGNGTSNGHAAATSEQRLKDILGDVVPDRATVARVLDNDTVAQNWAQSLARGAQALVASKSVVHVGTSGRYLNVVKHLTSLLPALWLADNVIGLSVKSDKNPHGEYQGQDLVEMCADLASYVFLDIPPGDEFILRGRASKAAQVVIKAIKGHLAALSGVSLSGLTDSAFKRIFGENEHSGTFLTALLNAAGPGRSHDALAAGLVAELVDTAALYSRALAEVIDYYLDATRQEQFTRLASSTAQADAAELVRAIHVALDSQAAVHAASAPSIYSSAQTGFLRPELFDLTMCRVIQVVFSLSGLQRSAGPAGRLNQFVEPQADGSLQYLYLSPKGRVTSWPVSMIVQYNDIVNKA
ncbi:uncharacterized protein FIBRA_08446 [Fibroporia radiculosa]|uniref:Heme peroxidase n=1 Tax=Fibroporia radiculosa TaxID=599839 RepID=J4GHF4_9APHY|nr:uncharacterized protein FIBRA_08446 [Fibroporia radiculosa]CCM06203.1 predicted protein [Fibroporia radiculosa]